jgi:hypothetical protein
VRSFDFDFLGNAILIWCGEYDSDDDDVDDKVPQAVGVLCSPERECMSGSGDGGGSVVVAVGGVVGSVVPSG